MVQGSSPLSALENAVPLRLVLATWVPVPLAKPGVVLYSMPYAVMAPQLPVVFSVPATLAEELVMAEALPVATVGAVFTPLPLAATLMPVAPPPPTGMFPL